MVSLALRGFLFVTIIESLKMDIVRGEKRILRASQDLFIGFQNVVMERSKRYTVLVEKK